MARTISIGAQGFEDLRVRNNFYVDKTDFVRAWWQADDQVTLICRPRRFGKTLNLDTVRCFFSTEFLGRGEELFAGLDVWRDPAMRELQGKVPVVALSFARVKQGSIAGMLSRINELVVSEFHAHEYLYSWEKLSPTDQSRLDRIRDDMDPVTCAGALNMLCDLLRRYHGTRPVVLLDEYDAPMQEAWAGGFWDEATSFMRDLMNSTFKTNPSLERALITGVTRVGRESIFSDLNNLKVITSSSTEYRDAFGFVQDEVDEALEEYGLSTRRSDVCAWYDGFTFGGQDGIYNPWSVTQFLANDGVIDTYWANTSGNGLISSVVRRGDNDLKHDFEVLLQGGVVDKVIDEQVVFSELATRPNAVWALLLGAGYLTSPGPVPNNLVEAPRKLVLTNREVKLSFDRMVEGWFGEAGRSYGDFADALLADDVDAASDYLSEVVAACASSFDSATRPSERNEPERFYHGLVLGLLVRLRGRYAVESNRESGFGRYDVALVPTSGTEGGDPALILEFKVFDPRHEEDLEDTVLRALGQIDDKCYVVGLVERGFAPECIRTYGIGFRGKEVLVG